jgi:hypothetical protein
MLLVVKDSWTSIFECLLIYYDNYRVFFCAEEGGITSESNFLLLELGTSRRETRYEIRQIDDTSEGTIIVPVATYNRRMNHRIKGGRRKKNIGVRIHSNFNMASKSEALHRIQIPTVVSTCGSNYYFHAEAMLKQISISNAIRIGNR